MNLLSEALGLLAGALGLSLAAPQAIRVKKLGTFGVSRLAWILILITYSSWLGYGLRTGSPSQIVANAIAIILTIWLLYFLLASEKWKWPLIACIVLIFPVAMILLPEPLMSAFLLLTVAAALPQLVTAYLAWYRKTPAPAISKLSWSLSFFSGILWVAYAVVGERTLVIITSGINTTLAVAILGFTTLANRVLERQKGPKT